ncbi:hypothetical protein N658DRAFT_105601 [Parathielavia hyrcaniae]|uniref:Uncharacterized protein n=1 Tax=Parathielavia hyrcaniae TaxID=113614 RepID=A0AAN6Q211_9PEZI|nr:hypothetical protein N658DRAFT_105601 [Parathielavia hyrcaniae]
MVVTSLNSTDPMSLEGSLLLVIAPLKPGIALYFSYLYLDSPVTWYLRTSCPTIAAVLPKERALQFHFFLFLSAFDVFHCFTLALISARW